MTKTYPEFARLVDIMKKLRTPKTGCPWDLEQDHKSIKTYVIEEAYEVIDAIDSGEDALMQEELGDLLLQVVFHAQIAEDEKRFNIESVSKDIADKMVRRHPHVFGDVSAETSDEVLTNWDEIKKSEKLSKGQSVEKSVLDSVSRGMPALFENFKISKKVAKLGFDWKKPADVFEKIDEEVREVKGAIRKKNKKQIEEELGDLLFAVANLCRAYKVNPELALHSANRKFRKRFAAMESFVKKESLNFKNLKFKDWDALWNRAKKV